MFTIHLGNDVHIGDTVDVRINGEPARVTYRDAETLLIEPGDAHRIIKMINKGEMTLFVCADSDRPSNYRTYKIPPESHDRPKHWWIAIHGAACGANLEFPIEKPTVKPVPEMLVGFPTRDEAAAAQNFMVTASYEELEPKMRAWFARKDVRVVQPANPDPPPTEAQTAWLDWGLAMEVIAEIPEE